MTDRPLRRREFVQIRDGRVIRDFWSTVTIERPPPLPMLSRGTVVERIEFDGEVEIHAGDTIRQVEWPDLFLFADDAPQQRPPARPFTFGGSS
jgi:hypothetical protein